jgi:hypothetical protein
MMNLGLLRTLITSTAPPFEDAMTLRTAIHDTWDLLVETWNDLNVFGRVVFLPFMVVVSPIAFLVRLGMKE